MNDEKVWVANLKPQTEAFGNQQLKRVAAQKRSAKIDPTLYENTSNYQRNADNWPAHYNTA